VNTVDLEKANGSKGENETTNNGSKEEKESIKEISSSFSKMIILIIL